jgi:lipoprotein NlpD
LSKFLFILVALAVFAGCASSRPAPVSDRAPPRQASASTPAPASPVAKPSATAPSLPPPANEAVVTAPLKSAGGVVEARPLGAGPAPPPAAAINPTDKLVTEPKGVRLPYSDQALAQLSQGASQPPASARPDTDTSRGPDELDWMWPATGKVIANFNDTTTKGIAIAGKLGQPVLASAPGRVIFSGQGIRGFGKLIVVKHNNTYLSVYAHNNQLLVKEGQNVTRGQRIAEMGNSDTDQVKLHFEIRRLGKPVDPLRLLPPA